MSRGAPHVTHKSGSCDVDTWATLEAIGGGNWFLGGKLGVISLGVEARLLSSSPELSKEHCLCKVITSINI